MRNIRTLVRHISQQAGDGTSAPHLARPSRRRQSVQVAVLSNSRHTSTLGANAALRSLLVVLAVTVLSVTTLRAQDPPATEGDSAEPSPKSPVQQLAVEQEQLAGKYQRLEDLLFKMADFEAATNPRRAALLRQAFKQSKDRLTHTQLNNIVQLLQDRQLKRALDGQQTARQDLEALLELLQSENRSDRMKTEAQKIKDYIKELKRLESLQRSLRGSTEGGADVKQLAKNQQQVADRTGNLGKQLEKDAKSPNQDSQSQGKPGAEGESQEGKSPQTEPQEGQPNDGQTPSPTEGDQPAGEKEPRTPQEGEKEQQAKPEDQKPSDQKPSDQKPSDQKPSDQQGGEQPSEGESQEGKPSGQQQPPKGSPGQPPAEGQQGEQSPQQPDKNAEDENPAQQRVREAEQKMREAQQQLEKARRKESIEKQREAEEKLKEAIAELEEILRQLREEEVERMLALLEGRFRKMLEMQLKVYEDTIQLGKRPLEQRGRDVDILAGRLAFDERRIVKEADQCLTLLLEEGSSVAFPEVVEQIRDDMEEVSARLAQTKVDRITQGLEEEIVASLEEMIEALQKAQQEKEDSKSQGKPRPGQQQGVPPLVDAIAELRMIRSLQWRVNQRTQRYARLLDDAEDTVGQAVDGDLRRAIGKLAEREARIQRITRDIVLGKNR